MKRTSIFFFMLTFIFSTANSQSLTVDILLNFAQVEEVTTLESALNDKGFELSSVYGSPEVHLYMSSNTYGVPDDANTKKPNRFTISTENEKRILTCTTVDTIQYHVLKKQLTSPETQFVAGETRQHEFMEGIVTPYYSFRFPNLEVNLKELVVYQWLEGGISSHWKRFECEVVSRGR